MGFDPDQYLNDKKSEGSFDPDAYLSENGAQPEQPEPSFLNKLGHAATSTLPALGGMGAAALATPESFGMATIPAGALGYGMGAEARDFINNRLLGDEPTSVKPMDQAQRVAGNLKDGALQTGMGYGLSAAAPMMGKVADTAIEDIATNPYLGEKAIKPISNAIQKIGHTAAAGSALHGMMHGNVGEAVVGPMVSEATSMLANKLAPAAAGGLEKISQMLMQSPKFAELAKVSPQAFQALVSGVSNAMSSNTKSQSQPLDKNALIQKVQGTKYSQVLQNANSRGGNALGAANFVLQQTDPEYRKTVLGDEKGD